MWTRFSFGALLKFAKTPTPFTHGEIYDAHTTLNFIPYLMATLG